MAQRTVATGKIMRHGRLLIFFFFDVEFKGLAESLDIEYKRNNIVK